MIYIVIGVLSIGLIGCIWYIFRLKKNTTEREANAIERHQKEIAAAEEDFKSSYHEQENEWLDKMAELEHHYNNDVQTLNHHIGKLNKNLIDLQKYTRNAGEIVTHQILEQLKNELIHEGSISHDDMIILPNLFIPYEEEGYFKTRQIDHLVLLPTGFYVVETKYWRGKIIHGLTQENAGLFSFITDMMTPGIQRSKKKHTLVFVPDNEGKEIRIKSYGSPTQQVMSTALTLKDYISKHLARDDHITAVVYFGYSSDEDMQGVIDLSDNQNVPRLIGENEIRQYFRNQLKHEAKKHSKETLQQMKEDLENINYLHK
ncbi:nuclease-related domain-containing protein [Lentibacillus jeotgali]|uniref:nuclease-related domain-containing protein n=1 Tax=Lentibacillus jeotgali TaxID=558169 RepID=UPI0002627C0E|nr:nuclease-related domain-containing protein [Lentibacillus jeotgali]